jgi:hypothetical protein
MKSLPVHLFKDSFGPFLTLLNENKVLYTMREQRSGVTMASSSGVIEVLLSPTVLGGLALVIIKFLKVSHGRKVIITTGDNRVIQAENLTHRELEQVLEVAKSLDAIDTKSA